MKRLKLDIKVLKKVHRKHEDGVGQLDQEFLDSFPRTEIGVEEMTVGTGSC